MLGVWDFVAPSDVGVMNLGLLTPMGTLETSALYELNIHAGSMGLYHALPTLMT
jgi:hypothetical protein